MAAAAHTHTMHRLAQRSDCGRAESVKKVFASGTRGLICAAGLALAGLAALATAQMRAGDLVLFNHSHSLPTGFYLRVDAPVERGVIVTVRAATVAPLIAARRGFDGPRDRFLKRVAAGAGDVVCADRVQVTINGRISARRLAGVPDGRGGTPWTGCRRLGPRDLFLLGDTTDSFDGRYWGVTSRTAVEGVWRALFANAQRRVV